MTTQGHERAPAVLNGTLAGIPFQLSCDAPDVMAYAEHVHVPRLLQTADAVPQVTARLRWHEGIPPTREVLLRGAGADLERVDRDIYTDTTQVLHWLRVDDLRDVFLRFQYGPDGLVVDGDFYFRVGNSGLSNQLRRVTQRKKQQAMRTRRFPTLLYYMVYYPCWWLAEHRHGFHPIHAAGVAVGERVLLLAGTSGVGKSTLSIAAATQPGARLLSDSFVLHQGREVRSVPEPILLDAFSRQWIGEGAQALVPLEWGFGLDRKGYTLPPVQCAEGGHAAALAFPRRAPRAYMRQIPATVAHQRLSAADMIINDLRRYWAFAAVLEQMQPTGLMARREQQLAALTASVPCYEVGITAEMDSREAAESLLRVMDAPVTDGAADA